MERPRQLDGATESARAFLAALSGPAHEVSQADQAAMRDLLTAEQALHASVPDVAERFGVPLHEAAEQRARDNLDQWVSDATAWCDTYGHELDDAQVRAELAALAANPEWAPHVAKQASARWGAGQRACAPDCMRMETYLDFLREPDPALPFERPCVFGPKCRSVAMCQQRGKRPFVCREYVPSRDRKHVLQLLASGNITAVRGWRPERHLQCVLCHNHALLRDVTRQENRHTPVSSAMRQLFYFVVGYPGGLAQEYALKYDERVCGLMGPALFAPDTIYAYSEGDGAMRKWKVDSCVCHFRLGEDGSSDTA